MTEEMTPKLEKNEKLGDIGKTELSAMDIEKTQTVAEKKAETTITSSADKRWVKPDKLGDIGEADISNPFDNQTSKLMAMWAPTRGEIV